MSLISRRWFLGRAAETAAAATATAALAPHKIEPEESKGYFKHPAEYFAAMHAIGWRPLAMYQRCKDGTVHRMGVSENTPAELTVESTWGVFSAIQRRVPVQLAIDAHPDQDWWKWVWQYLYDKGEREDVTPARAAQRLAKGDEA